MLIRFSGGSSGFGNYMERGRKAGRVEDRDQLDRRVVLSGDLDQFERIVDGIEDSYSINKKTGVPVLANKYLRITLSFAEDHVPDEVMRKIVQDFKRMACAGFRDPEEIYIYAEAHVPRIKQGIDERSGELHDRLTHIHIAIPLRNMVTGTREEIFGMHGSLKHLADGRVEVSDESLRVKWIDAFQEDTNQRYGLKSPKDSPRNIGGKGEILQRQKGDEFPAVANAKEIKLWAAGLAETSRDYGSFRDQLSMHGEVLRRNKDTENEYLWFKPEGAKSGFNLRENGFRPAYFDAPVGSRVSLTEPKAKEYLDVSARAGGEGLEAGRKTKYDAIMDDWKRYGALEMRFAGAYGRRDRYGITNDMTPEEKLAILEVREAKFYKKHAEKFNLLESENGRGFQPAGFNYDGRDRGGRDVGDLNGAAGRALAGSHADRRGDGSESVIQPLPELRQSRAGDGRSSEDSLVLPGDVQRHQGGDHEMHRLGGRADRNQGGSSQEQGQGLIARLKPVALDAAALACEESSSEVGQMVRDLTDRIQHEEAQGRIAEIKKGLQPERLLASLADSHRLNTKLYKVEGQNIVAGTRSLTLNDFLTKEMHLPWPQAEAILHQNWEQQQRAEPYRAPEQASLTDKQLWGAFREWKTQRVADNKREYREIQDRKTAALSEVRQQGKADRKEIREQGGKGREAYLQRTEAISRQRMTQVFAEAAVLRQANAERDATYKNGLGFQDFLIERSNQGDQVALNRLRKMAPDFQLDGNKTAGQPKKDIAPMPIENIQSVVDRRGTVSYFTKQGEFVLADSKDSVVTRNESKEILQLQLDFSIKKFGYENLKLNGTDTFVDSMIRMAADKRFSKLTFSNESHQARLDQYRAEYAEQHKKPQQKQERPAQAPQANEVPTKPADVAKVDTKAALNEQTQLNKSVKPDEQDQQKPKQPAPETTQPKQEPKPATDNGRPQFAVDPEDAKLMESGKAEETATNKARIEQASTEIKKQEAEPAASPAPNEFDPLKRRR